MATEEQVVANVLANPKYHDLVKRRSTFGWTLTIIMLVVYYGYIAIIAFDKEFLARRLGEGVTTTVGMPVGFGIILFTIIITALYVRRANTEYDRITAEIVQEARK